MLGPPMTRGSSCSIADPCRLGAIARLLAAAVLVIGCGKKSAPGATAPPADMAGAGAEAAGEPDWVREVAGDPLTEAQAELEAYEDAMLSAGVELSEPVKALRTESGKPTAASTSAEGDPPAARCERICDLARHV